MGSELYSLCWDNFHHNMSSGMNSLLETEDLVDVTIAVGGRYLKAHKMVLSVCSPYFRELFKSTPCKHPIVFLKDVSYTAMSDLLQFIYQGEVQVSQEHLSSFITTAEALQIKGLTGDGTGLVESTKKNQERMKTVETEVSRQSLAELETQPKEPSSPAPKRPRLEETDPSESSVVKSEPSPELVTESAPSNEQLFKIEPISDQDQDLDMVDDDNFGDGLIDDPFDSNENFTILESGDEELKAEKNEDGHDSSAVTAIPEKSREKYEQAYGKFEEWCQQRQAEKISQSLVLAYFEEKAKTQKSSTLWCYYSMLRSMLYIKKEIDIKNYSSLITFLKRASEGYKATKGKMFTKQDIERFLKEADDRTYLMMKLVLILGIAGSCRREELTYMRIDDVRDEGDYIQIVVPSRKMGTERDFILTDGIIKGFSLLKMFRKYVSLRNPRSDHQRFFVNYRNGQCTAQPVGINTIGSIPSKIASFLGLENPRLYTTDGLRKVSPFLLVNFGEHLF